MKGLSILAALIVVVVGVGLILGHSNAARDEDPYNQMVTIKGRVEILNHPEMGRTPGNGIYLLFQRDDCKRCLIATTADADGKYKIRVGRGRYKIIVDNPSPPTYDMLAPNQPRYVTANLVVQDNEFDIKLLLPSSR